MSYVYHIGKFIYLSIEYKSPVIAYDIILKKHKPTALIIDLSLLAIIGTLLILFAVVMCTNYL